MEGIKIGEKGGTGEQSCSTEPLHYPAFTGDWVTAWLPRDAGLRSLCWVHHLTE